MSLAMLVAVASGGAMGSLARYLTMSLVGRWTGSGFPWGTLAVNIAGSFLMGMVVELIALRYSVSQEVRAFFAVGILGGFTTFSSFSLDAALLIERGHLMMAFTYIAGSVVAGLAALFVALYLVRQIVAGG